jgi:hypothetical protein
MAKSIRYQGQNVDIHALVKEIEMWFRERRFNVQIKQAEGRWCLKARKDHFFRRVVGAGRAFDVYIFGDSNNFSVEIRTGLLGSNLIGVGITGFFTGGVALVFTLPIYAWSQKIRWELRRAIDEDVMFGPRALPSTGASRQLSAPSSQHIPQSLDESANQLRSALETGILTLAEYEVKLAALTGTSTLDTSQTSKEETIRRLKDAFASEILTADEFKRKMKELALEDQIDELHKAFESGVVTEREFQQKRKELLDMPLSETPDL